MRSGLAAGLFRRNMSTYKYVIVGGGNSAGYAVRAFVGTGVQPGDLCLVGSEKYVPYERPALSKAVLMKAEVRLPKFHTCVGGGGDSQPPEWYKEKGIELKLGQKVVEADLEGKTVVLEDGTKVTASEGMMLATGAMPIRLDRMPGGTLDGICYLRENDDAMVLYDGLQSNIGKNVVVIGGGYIGMEVAAAALTVGCSVTMVFPEDHLMSRLFTPEIAQYYEGVYEKMGCKMVKGGWLCQEFLEGTPGKVRGVKVGKDGEEKEVAGDLVVVGVGARVNSAVFKDKVEVDERGGIIVDERLETSVKGVYAVGDLCNFPLKMYGGRRTRMEHVQHARDSATHAVHAMVSGSGEPYDYLPYFYSRVFDLSWQFFGDSSGECLVCGSFDPKLLAIWVEGNAVKGVFMEHPSAEDTANMKRIARDGATVDVEAFKKCDTVEQGWGLLV